MSRKKLATAIACAVFTGAACASGVSAAEVYELNPVLVTAHPAQCDEGYGDAGGDRGPSCR